MYSCVYHCFLSADVATYLLYQAIHSPSQLLCALAFSRVLYFLNHYNLDMLMLSINALLKVFSYICTSVRLKINKGVVFQGES